LSLPPAQTMALAFQGKLSPNIWGQTLWLTIWTSTT
jgi:hypothetical protein